MSADRLALYRAVKRAASSFDEQMLIVAILANRMHLGPDDIQAVRDALLAPIFDKGAA